jgi:hypothetical protein
LGEIGSRSTNGNIGLSETIEEEFSVFISLEGPALVQKELGGDIGVRCQKFGACSLGIFLVAEKTPG